MSLKTKQRWKKSIPYFLLCIPAMVYNILFHDIPLYGIVLAFKKYEYTKGIWGSSWIGFENFKFYFKSVDFKTTITNSLFYSLAFMLVTSLLAGIVFAILLYEVNNKFLNRSYQTVMMVPNFVSIVVISYILYMLINNGDSGIINNFLRNAGLKTIDFYNEPKYWRFILVFIHFWCNAGMASLYFYSALLAIDPGLFEAASLDGCGKLKRIWYIEIPELKPMICMVLVMQMGKALSNGMGFFYSLTKDSGALYKVTDVIETYTYRGLVSGKLEQAAAVGLFQTVVGLVLIIVSNQIVKKISPENKVF